MAPEVHLDPVWLAGVHARLHSATRVFMHLILAHARRHDRFEQSPHPIHGLEEEAATNYGVPCYHALNFS
jgi:hypothetical protein